MARTTIGVIAKSPVIGTVKTRLCPPLTPAEAARVAAALVVDTTATALSTGWDTWCVHTGAGQPLRRLLAPAVRFWPQRGRGLAQRLANAQADLFGLGYDHVVLLGADCPTVDRDDLVAAVVALDNAPLVVGPALDGGYVLIATSAAEARLFDDVEMSTDRVLEQTVAQASVLGWPTHLLEPRSDLDTAADLREALLSGALAHAPMTRAACADLLSVARPLGPPEPAAEKASR